MAQHLRIKICGVTGVADALDAVRLGADALGLNFHPGSPRSITADVAGEILRAIPPFIETVGVFVEQPLQVVRELFRELGRIHTIQMHGQQPEPMNCYPFHFIPAFAVRDEAGLQVVERYLTVCRERGCLPAAVLVDGHAPGQHGGTGRTAPWELLASFRPGVPLILAGGLTPDNVAEAVRTVRPYGVDVASGVESMSGKKDVEKLRDFIANARAGVEESALR